MKTIFFFIHLLCIYLVQSQNNLITYNASLNINIDSEEYSKKQKEYIQVALSSSRDVQYILIIQKEKSLFKKIDKMVVDDNQDFNPTELLAGKGFFYSDIKQKEIIEMRKAFGETFLIPRKPVSWKLTEEVKIINNYKCKKATTVINVYRRGKTIKKNVTAWYTDEIPLSFGPKLYNGLPGLIIELQEGNLNLKLFKIQFNVKNIVIEEPKEGQFVSLKDFNNIVREIRRK